MNSKSSRIPPTEKIKKWNVKITYLFKNFDELLVQAGLVIIVSLLGDAIEHKMLLD